MEPTTDSPTQVVLKFLIFLPRRYSARLGLVQRETVGIEVAVILVGNNSKMGLNETEVSFGKTGSVEGFYEKTDIRLSGINTWLFISSSTASADFPYNPGQGQAIRNGVNRNSAIIGGR